MCAIMIVNNGDNSSRAVDWYYLSYSLELIEVGGSWLIFAKQITQLLSNFVSRRGAFSLSLIASERYIITRYAM